MTDARPATDLVPTILLVDDDNVFRQRLARALRDRGFDTLDFENPREAIASARADPPELAVVDLRTPELSGLDVVRMLRAIEPSTRILVLTGYGSIATALEAVKLGAVHYLTKPATVDEILRALDGEGLARDAADVANVPSLARVEWEHINRVLTECGGNISRAARLLNMHRRSLQRKLAKFPVNQ
jgi:two-component system response regulator RegA